jgi:hypothetical protein
MATILPKKTELETPTAVSDTHHKQLAADTTVPQFPPTSTYGDDLSKPVQVPTKGTLTMATTSDIENPIVVPTTSIDHTSWLGKRWRPMMALVYMLTCLTDFVIFPVLWSGLQALFNGSVTTGWQPLTLLGGGLYHISMGAILGISAYGRTKEKIEGVST